MQKDSKIKEQNSDDSYFENKTESKITFFNKVTNSKHANQIPISKTDYFNLAFFLDLTRHRDYEGGEYFTEFIKNNYSNFEKLENDHDYIQWIFPIAKESRFNFSVSYLVDLLLTISSTFSMSAFLESLSLRSSELKNYEKHFTTESYFSNFSVKASSQYVLKFSFRFSSNFNISFFNF